MSLYNLLFGRNPQSALLLAAIGFKENDVERYRDVHVEDDGATIAIYTRTGGGNREDYPQVALYRSPLFKGTEDDDFDSTYATFYFSVPPEFIDDIRALSDPLKFGLRKEFGEHLSKTLNREATESDKQRAAYDAEKVTLRKLSHSMANGHTFVPHDDWAAREAMKLAEANGGKLRSCWGILPLMITVKRDFAPWPGMKTNEARFQRRIDVGYEWKIDEACWARWQEFFAGDFPLTMARIAESVAAHRERAA